MLSELYFYLAFAVLSKYFAKDSTLWIAFRIVFLLGIRSSANIMMCEKSCCELLSELYFYLAFAVLYLNTLQTIRCELLSELYFYLAFAVMQTKMDIYLVLWIAFRIVFLLGIRSKRIKRLQFIPVVNCFQNCIFTWHSQLFVISMRSVRGCELLSELYFYLAFAV